MNFQLTKTSEKELEKLSRGLQKSILVKITRVDESPITNQIKKLENSPYFRLRIGDYRVVFRYFNKSTIQIIHVAHRKNVYRLI